MKRIYILFTLFAFCLAFAGCVQEELVPEEEGEDSGIVGEFVNARLCLSVGDLTVDSPSTRSEEPSDDPEPDTERERYIEGIWVFQFNAAGTSLVNGGQYMTITDQSVLEALPTLDANSGTGLLTDNDGQPSIVYVVANVGSSSWISTSGLTLAKLMSATIPSAEPIFAGASDDWTIPMSGQTSGTVTVKEGERIIVPVYRMFAKLMVGLDIEDIGYTAVIETIDVSQVASTCEVSTIYSGTPSATGTYASGTTFMPWAYDVTGITPEEGNDYPYVIYVPENISGEVAGLTLDDTDEKVDNAPENAMMLSAFLHMVEADGTVITPSPHYTICPGGNVYNNYNVRRNCVYRIMLTISPPTIISPSANCLVATAGTTIAFYPYYRDETGHRDDGTGGELVADYYDFEYHLDSTGEKGPTISTVKIIWQDEDVIGNNSDGSKVKLEVNDEDNFKTRIKVVTNKAGNALIGAYDSSGNVIWSWHIWVVQDIRPDNLADAVQYWHYDWNSSGIQVGNWVLGTPVMRCNLGAMKNAPTAPDYDDYVDTYGLLYQWGRKDPFPQPKISERTSGPYNYDEDDCNIWVYDNSAVHINLSGNDGSSSASSNTDVFRTVLTTAFSKNEDAIDYSIAYPTRFIACTAALENSTDSYNNIYNYLNQGDWLATGDDDLWGGNKTPEKTYQVYYIDKNKTTDNFVANLRDNYGKYKTIFDPCPYGWRVSAGDIWLGFTDDGMNFEYSSDVNNMVAEHLNSAWTGTQIANRFGFMMYMQADHSGDTCYFPLQGTRWPSGQPSRVGQCGNYYNATVDETVSVWIKTSINHDGVINKDDGDSEYLNAIRRVDILHFHKNSGTNSSTMCNPFDYQPIYFNRATACPLRCVRDTSL